MTDVVEFPGVTKLDLDPDRVLGAAVGELSSAIVIGYTKDGEEYFASSISNGPETLWLLERMKLKLLQIVEEIC